MNRMEAERVAIGRQDKPAYAGISYSYERQGDGNWHVVGYDRGRVVERIFK